MKKIITLVLIAGLLFSVVPSNAYAVNTATHGEIPCFRAHLISSLAGYWAIFE